MKMRYNRFLLTCSVLLSFIFGFVISSLIVIYYSIPASNVIPPTQRFTAVKKNNLNIETIKSQDLSIHFLELGNVNAGDCTLIKVGNTEILIDAGSRANSVTVIHDYLDQYVTDGTLEYVIVTHAHQDHIAGFGTNADVESLFDLYQVDTVIQFVKTKSKTKVYQNYLRELNELQERCDTKVYNALQCYNEEGDAQRIYNLDDEGKIQLEILDQKFYHSEFTTDNENNNSVCCQIVQNNEKYYLFTGDLEEDGESSLVNRNDLHPVELYKAGHHGSKTSSSQNLLSVIQPKCVCVCCCAGSEEYTKNNDNQFPTQKFIDNIAEWTSQIYVTTLCLDYHAGTYESLNGNIVVYCKLEDTEISVACSNNNTILKDTEWFKANRKMPDYWVTA